MSQSDGNIRNGVVGYHCVRYVEILQVWALLGQNLDVVVADVLLCDVKSEDGIRQVATQMCN